MYYLDLFALGVFEQAAQAGKSFFFAPVKFLAE
jgi:hypothetical protein